MTPEQQAIYVVEMGQDLPMPGLSGPRPTTEHPTSPSPYSGSEPFGRDADMREAFEAFAKSETNARYTLSLLQSTVERTKYHLYSTQAAFNHFRAGYETARHDLLDTPDT